MKSIAFLSVLFFSSASMSAPDDAALEAALKHFDENPLKFMETIPEKARRNSVTLVNIPEVESLAFIPAKNEQRQLRGRAGIRSNDRAEDLVDNGARLVRSLKEMEAQNLTKAKLETMPWSDYYWALYRGQLAFRYADAQFPASEDWKANHDFLQNSFPSFLPAVTDADSLSPAEKYDLLVGDMSMGMTRKALAEGEGYYRAYGKVERWMGLCHGWAAASYMMDRPRNAIKVMAADGKTMINFYPSDIKSLATLLWSVSPGETAIVGGRCNVKKPKKNRQGRVVDQDCFDTNPGSWHLAVVNQIGVSRRSLIMDATFDYEVWNHPIISYSYRYFNPQTLKAVSSLEGAMVPIGEYTKDKFKQFRSKKAAYVVGVSMTVDYTVETEPTTDKRDSEKFDETNSVTYQYDLELDENGNIIGGEWYRNAHPDFLWTPTPGSRAFTPGDRFINPNGQARWDGKSPMPRDWQDVARRSSEAGIPLATIVESLIDLSNKKRAR